MSDSITGTCQCGQVRYRLFAPPKLVLACHCTECQKLSTGPFSVTAFVPADAIEFTGDMKEWSRSSDSGNRNNARFCPGCGNRIYHYNPADSSILKLKLKPVHMPDDTLFEPTAHVWVSEKLSWVQIPDGVKVYDKQP